jgi:hypothetical protein
VAWGALIRAAARAGNGAGGMGGAATEPLVTETPYRWVQLGWLE